MGGGYVWDDITLIERDLVLLDWTDLGDLWAGPIRAEGPGASYYRPFALTIMAILGRAGPWAIHLLTLGLHAGSCYLLTRIVHATRWPLAGGVVFAVHPMNSEVLGWCSALPDAMAVFLALLSVRLWSRSILVTLLVLLLGCLSKETALLIPLGFGLAGMLPRGWSWFWLIASGCTGALRLSMGATMTLEWTDKLTMAPAALFWSVGNVMWPFPITAVRDLWVAPESVLILGGLLGVVMTYFARNQRCGLVGIALMLSGPTLALPVMLDGYLVAERYMYVSLVGVALWLSSVVSPSAQRHWVWLPVMGSLVVHGGRAGDWQSSLTLFQQAVKAQPESSYAWHFLGVSLAENGLLSEAADSFERAVLLGHPHPMDRFLRLKALVLAGRAKEAIQWAKEGPQEDLTADSIAWRARAEFSVGNFQDAMSLLALLKTPHGHDGPPWVEALLSELYREIEASRIATP